MALQKTMAFKAVLNTVLTDYMKTVSEEEITYKIIDCYIRVGIIEGDKDSLIFSVDFYGNQLDTKPKITKRYQFKPSIEDTAPNFIKQAYEYLKTLDDFFDAIDILETGQTVA